MNFEGVEKMRRIKLTIVFLIIAVLGFNCEENSTSPDNQNDTPAEVNSLTKQAIIESDNTFGLSLLKNVLSEKPDTNVFISPLSVSLALSMTLNGAAGETEEAIRKTLGFESITTQDVNVVQAQLMQRLMSTDPDVLFEIANSIWYRENYPILESFKTVNEQYYDAEIRELDFSLVEAVTIINDWINAATHGKIDDVIDRIDPSVVMFLINALYFKGSWQVEFDDSKTYLDTFTGPGQATTQVHMMQREDSLAYYEDDLLQAVELPYGEGQYSMMVLLPKETVTVTSVLEQMSLEAYQTICNGLTQEKGQLLLPKFKIEFEMLLNDVLKTMGMGVAFGMSADFSNINGTGGLYVSRVIHKTFVEVDEQGTEAAAVTVVEIRELSIPQEFFMNVNKPFLFLIRDTVTNTIIFAGHVASPNA